MKPIAFIDLAAQQAYLDDKIKHAMGRVLDHGKYIMGPEIGEFERAMCEFSGASNTISCSSGTDAILMPLMAWGIGAGDAVIVPSFTFASTAEAVAFLGATPVFVDCQADTFNLDPTSVAIAIEETNKNKALTLKAIIAVDLFGQIADYPAISKLAKEHNLKVISDAAQGFGATLDGVQSIQWCDAVTTSFFPAKPLGCYGDGGAVLTNDDDLADLMKSIRVHGKGSDKYDNVRIGMNARLDTLQAAILLEKIAIFGEEIEKRNQIAQRFEDALGATMKTPFVIKNGISTWAQYTLQLDNRDEVAAKLKEEGVPTAIYYGKPLHLQTAYKHFPSAGNGLTNTERLADQVLSLPMHPYLETDQQNHICESLLKIADKS